MPFWLAALIAGLFVIGAIAVLYYAIFGLADADDPGPGADRPAPPPNPYGY